MEEGFVNVILYLSYILIAVSILGALILPLVNAVDDPKSLVKVGASAGIMVVLFLIAYAFSGSEVTETYAKFSVGPELSKVIGGILTMVYFLIVILIGGIIYVEVSKLFK